MSLAIAGRGWVTPLGSGIDEVWQQMRAGKQPTAERISTPESARSYSVFRVPQSAIANAPIHPRLRRSSAISRFAVVAGFAALQEAGVELTREVAERTALIFAVSNGGVVYTKRFYHDVVATGAQAASPLLFPETVFNAPASHLAAILGITGVSYTVVGDGAVGVLAMQMADELMQNDAFDHCLVVGAEEADWLLCDAYSRWRLVRDEPPISPFQSPPRGTILSEGAGAVLLSRQGNLRIGKIVAGPNFQHQCEAADSLGPVFEQLGSDAADAVVASANGTFIDAGEAHVIRQNCGRAKVHTPKQQIGESVGASALWQIIYGAQLLRDGEAQSAIISTCGLNQQVAGLRLVRQHG